MGRFDELLQLLLDDELSAEQLDELTAIAATDEALLTKLRQYLLISDRLSQYEDQLRSEDRFVDAMLARFNAENDASQFVERVITKVRERALSHEHHDTTHQAPSRSKKQPISGTDCDLDGQDSRNRRGRSSYARGIAGWLTAAIALVLLVALLVSRRNQNLPVAVNAQPDEIKDTGVAVLTRVSNPGRASTVGFIEGETIPPGVIQWEAGILQLEFYSGATLVLEGPAEIEIQNESTVVCRAGRLRAHVPEPARGFVVMAPSFELIDRGTDFGLSVSPDGTSEVHVFDGKVELYDAKSNRNHDSPRELFAGDAVTVQRDGTSESIATQDAEFITSTRLSQLEEARQRGQYQRWREFSDSLPDDPRVVAYFPFDRSSPEDRLLAGIGANGTSIAGAIVGCEWAEGRWPDKPALQFKRPGDRVRISVPGEFESLTYSTWLRLDGLDRRFNSLLLTDGFGNNSPHWQIRQEGTLVMGILREEVGLHSYKSDSFFNLFRLGQWVHLATVYDASQARVTHYVNGKKLSREPLMEPSSGLLKIGSSTIGNWSLPTPRHSNSRVRNLNGCMDELIVFGAALEDHEVNRLYEVGRP